MILIFTSALAGCVQQTEPLPLTEDEVGEWSVVVTIILQIEEMRLQT